MCRNIEYTSNLSKDSSLFKNDQRKNQFVRQSPGKCTCGKTALFGVLIPSHCGKCKTPEMKDLVNKRCEICQERRATMLSLIHI